MKLKPAFLDKPGIAEFVNIPIDEILSMVSRGKFPAPRQVSERKTAWLASEVDEWIKDRPQSKPRYENSNGRVFHLYRHFDSEGVLLYVGVSLSALTRLVAHQQNSHWFWDIGRVDVSKFETRQASLDAEIQAIRNEKPLYNILHNTLEQVE